MSRLAIQIVFNFCVLLQFFTSADDADAAAAVWLGGWVVGGLVGLLGGWLFGWLVGWVVGGLVGWLGGCCFFVSARREKMYLFEYALIGLVF